MAKTKMVAEAILTQSMAETGKPYLTPEQLSTNVERRVREEKEVTTDLRAQLTEKVAHERPRGCQEGVNGTVTRLVYEHLHNAKVPDDPELTLKPDCSKTIRQVKTRVRYHNGVFEERKFDAKSKKAWSCCQSKYEDDAGCCTKVVDKQKWILSTYNQ